MAKRPIKNKSKKQKIPHLHLEIIGWLGVVLVVSAYALVSLSVLQPSSITYQSMNIVGSIGILIISVKKRVYQSVLTNIFWIFIALIGIISTIINLAS